jgi:hypothetical protein
MQDKIEALKTHVREKSANPDFVHHKWFVKWYLEIVERLTLELADKYAAADRDLVTVMAWMHDYGKILDFDHEYEATLSAGPRALTDLGFEPAFANKVIDYIGIMDKKLEIDLREAPLEVQIVASADGCSHLVGPFMHVFWHEATDPTFANKTYEELMQENLKKARKDWQHKIVLPEARQAFEARHRFLCEQSGELPDKFLT